MQAVVMQAERFEHVGYSNRYPGGYGEKMILPEELLVPVPGDLPSDLAALTEPLAVGVHAVAQANLAGDEVPIVIGGGPPKFTRVVVVGVCMQSDTIDPIVGMGREMNIHWAFGYTGQEFADTLHGLADGKIDADALITSSADPDGVAGAFEAAGDPEGEIKVMIDFNN